MTEVSKERSNFITILSIAVPIVIQSLFLHLQVLIDRAFLGKINPEYFSAISNVSFLYFSCTEVLTAIAVGTTILIAQNLGADKTQNAQSFSVVSFKFNLLMSFMLFLFWFFCHDTLFKLMGVQEPILGYSIRFVKYLTFSFLFFGVEATAVSIFQGIGYTIPIMYTGIIRTISIIVFDWVLIFGNLGFPAMDIEGSALATTISNLCAGSFLTLYLLLYKNKPFQIRFKEVIISKFKPFIAALKLGIPVLLESFLWQIGNLAILRLLNAFNFMAAGIYNIIFSLAVIPYFFYIGIARAAITIVGKKTGAHDKEGTIKVLLICLKYTGAISVFFGLLFIFFPKPLLQIFTNDTSLITKMVPCLIATAITIFPRSVNVVVGHAIRGRGDTKWMFYTQLFGTVYMIILCYLLTFQFHMGFIGVFLAILIDETTRALINLFRFFKHKEGVPVSLQLETKSDF